MAFSFWEDNYYSSSRSIVVIGAGITGLSTAISLKEKDANRQVVVIDRFLPAHGASTKNAGFVCFGSPSELIDDLSHMTEEACKDIIKMRWKGAAILKERLQSKGYAPEANGGYELYTNKNLISNEKLAMVNTLMEQSIGIAGYFERGEQNNFPRLSSQCIFMPHEAQINPMTMMHHLMDIAQHIGVKFIFGHEVTGFDFDEHQVMLSNGEGIAYESLGITTNGFTRRLLPHIDVHAARNQVLMTNEIPDLRWQGVYHFDKGYYYFRRYGNRILLGGARNKDLETEMTDEFGNSLIIMDELTSFLEENILGHNHYTIEKWWSGILGIGPSKYPILEEVEKDAFVAVRLGGMGVAIGSLLGEDLSKKLMSR